MTGLSRADVADLEAAIDAKVASASRPKSSRQQARVTRVDADGTVWVHVFGGAEETPLRSNTASVEPGDVIDVTFTGLSLRGGGNVSDPAASSGQLRDAARRAEAARLAAESAEESAGRASEAADEAKDSAARASSAADEAGREARRASDQADEATRSASDAAAAAAGAGASASSALAQLSEVERVVGTLSWIAEHGRYEPSGDSRADDSKVYYERTGSGTEDDPYAYAPVADPRDADVAGYYVLAVDESVQNYIASHLALTDAGLWVTLDDGGYRLLLSATGAVVYDPHGAAVSTFGESIRFDSARPQRIGNDEAYVEFYDSDGDGEPDAIRIAGSDLNATAGRLAAMVRQYGDGVLVCRQGNAVGALVNADGSFDVVGVTWSGGSPTAGDAVMKADGDGLRTRKAMLSNAGTGAMLLMRTWDSGGMTGQGEIDIVRDAEGAYIALESSNDYTALLRRCTIGPSGAVAYLDSLANLHMGDLSANDVVAYELMAIADGRAHKLTEKADASDAIKSITRSGTTFTATRADGTTFTFTQQDSNSLTGVKGNAETSYRTGNVNLTPANIGAAESDHTHADIHRAMSLHSYVNTTPYIVIDVNSYTSWMLSFDVSVYAGYEACVYHFSGYNYGTSHWYAPKAVLVSSSAGSSKTVYFGWYSDWHLWIAVPAGSYAAISISNVTNGYTQVSPQGLFSVKGASSVPSTSQSTQQLHWHHAKTVLYDNATGTNGTVTLAYSAASYNHMRIYFRGNDSQHDSLDVCSPNGKVAALVVHEGTSNTSLNEKRKAVSISGTSITNRNYSEIDNSGSPSAANNVYITRVEAWSE